MFKAGEVVKLGRGKYGLPDVIRDGGKPPEEPDEPEGGPTDD
jgi:hypothetical protein